MRNGLWNVGGMVLVGGSGAFVVDEGVGSSGYGVSEVRVLVLQLSYFFVFHFDQGELIILMAVFKVIYFLLLQCQLGLQVLNLSS